MRGDQQGELMSREAWRPLPPSLTRGFGLTRSRDPEPQAASDSGDS